MFGVPVALHPLLLGRRPDGDAPERLSRALLHQQQLPRPRASRVPYFFNLAPNYDLTLTPSFYTLQGPFLDAEWRQRTENGDYSVRFQRHRPAAARRKFLPAALWRGQSEIPRLGGERGQVLSNTELDGRLGPHPAQRPLLPQRLPPAGARSDAILSSRTSSARSICADRRGAASSTSQRLFVPADDRLPRPAPGADRRPDVRLSPHVRPRRRPLGRASAARPRSSSTPPTSTGRRRSIRRSARSDSTRLQSLQHLRDLHAGHDRRTIACCAASPATTRARPNRFPGQARSSIRSARCGSRSYSSAPAAKRPSLAGGEYTYSSSTGDDDHPELRAARVLQRPEFRLGGAPAWPGVGLEYRYPFVSEFGLRPADHRADRPDHRAA